MTHVNLLSPSYIAKRNLRQAFKQWSIAVGLGMLVVGVWVACEYAAMVQSNNQLSYIRTEYEKQRATRSEIKKLKERRNLLQDREQETFRLDDDVPLLDLLGVVAKASAASNGRIHVADFRFNKSVAGRGVGMDAHTLQVQGVAENTVAIARFAAFIRDTDIFDAVELASTGIAQTGLGKSHRTFDIQCSLSLSVEGDTIQ